MPKYDDDLWALRKEADYLSQPKQRRIGEQMHGMVMSVTHELQQHRNEPATEDVPTTLDVLSLLGELGEAWRGDWADFDGRQLRHQLDMLSAYVAEITTVEEVRRAWGVCALGRGHWTQYCSDYNCGDPQT